MAEITINQVAVNAGSLIVIELVATGITWKSPTALTHLYSIDTVPMMLDQSNGVLYIHDESGNHLLIFTDAQAHGKVVTNIGAASSAADLYDKIKGRFA